MTCGGEIVDIEKCPWENNLKKKKDGTSDKVSVTDKNYIYPA